MKALWPRTLSGRLILLMLLAVALSQVVTLGIYRLERAKVLRNVVGEECLGRAISSYRLAEFIPPEARAETLKTLETPLTRYWVSSGAILSPEEWQEEARQRLVRPVASSGAKQSPPASLFEHDSMLKATAEASWKTLRNGPWLLRRPVHTLDLAPWNGFGFSMQLDDNSWLNMVYAKPSSLLQPSLTPGYYTALAITILIFAIVAIFVARRISQPLRHLAKSAERLGRGEQLELLPEEGPEDIQSTIEAFNLMQTRLRSFLEDRMRMLAAIGHDLRTPITSLRLRTEFIPDPETREKFTATLDEMQSMTEAALSFVRSESVVEPTRAVDIGALVESICDDLGELGLAVELQESERIPYSCRPQALRRAIRNVIENAVRYGDRARVRLETFADHFEIIVEDDGPGIPESDRERVFNPFVRIEGSRNRDTGGVGLGLSLARSTIRNHGGDITLSHPASGFCVHIKLPKIEELP